MQTAAASRVNFTRASHENLGTAAKLAVHAPIGARPFHRVQFAVICLHPSSGAMRHLAATLLVASGAVVHAQTGLDVRSPMQGEGLKPEASFEQRIDPWSRLTLRVHADPTLGVDAGAKAGADIRLLTQRLDAHQLQAGASFAFAPTAPDAVQAWQPFDDGRPTVFMQDRWQWTSQVSVTAGARLVNVPGGTALHDRLSLAWQPVSDWTLRFTDGSVRLTSPPADGLGLRIQRFQGVELQTDQSAGNVQVQAKLASQLVNDALQPQVLHAATLTLTAPLDDQWTLGGDSVISSQGSLMRLKLSGSMAHDKAKLSLVVPRRLQGRAIDPALNGSLPAFDANDNLGWRTQLEVRF